MSPGSSITGSGLVSPLFFLSMILLYSSSSSLLTLSKGFFAYGDLNTVAWCWKSLWMMPLLAAPICKKELESQGYWDKEAFSKLCLGILFKHFPSPSLLSVRNQIIKYETEGSNVVLVSNQGLLKRLNPFDFFFWWEGGETDLHTAIAVDLAWGRVLHVLHLLPTQTVENLKIVLFLSLLLLIFSLFFTLFTQYL